MYRALREPALGEGAVEIGVNRSGDLIIKVNGEQAGVLRHAGDGAFFPAGAPAVRIRFTSEGPGRQSLTIIDHIQVITAARIP